MRSRNVVCGGWRFLVRKWLRMPGRKQGRSWRLDGGSSNLHPLPTGLVLKQPWQLLLHHGGRLVFCQSIRPGRLHLPRSCNVHSMSWRHIFSRWCHGLHRNALQPRQLRSVWNTDVQPLPERHMEHAGRCLLVRQ